MTGRIVIAAYKPKPGQQEQLEKLIASHLAILRNEDLVTDRQSIIMKADDGTILEVFEWKSKQAIESAHENPAVLKMWQDYAEVCDYIPAGQVAEISQLFSEFTPLN